MVFSTVHVCADMPAMVALSNVRGTEFTVSWITQSLETGKVRYGTNIADHTNWKTVSDDRGNEIKDDIHYIAINHLIPQTIYYYEIISGDTIDNNNGRYYRINTGPAFMSAIDSCMPAGKVYQSKENGIPAYDSIVYVRIVDNENIHSALESILVTPETGGNWFVNLFNFRTQDHSSPYPFECGKSTIQVKAQGSSNEFSTMTIKAVDYSISESPSIDFSKSSPAQFLSTTSDILKGQPGNKFSVHLNYHTSGIPQFNDFGIRVHYDSQKLQFTDISNPYTGMNAPVDQIETQNENDTYTPTNRFVKLMWPESGNRLSTVTQSIRLVTINFTVNDQVDFGETSMLRVISMENSNQYQFIASPVTFKAVPYNLDIDCDGEVSALTDGLLILRYLFGFASDEEMLKSGTNTSFLNGIVDTENGTCITEEEIIKNIEQLMPK